jgi:hypothetical protein
LIWVERLEVRVLAVAIALTAAEQASAAGEETDSAKPAAPERSFSRGLVELKRQATSRGTPEETTKTNLKFDYFPEEGIVALLRLELPFPD